MRDDLGRRAEYRYDAAGRLVEAADLAGETWRFAYEAGRLSAIADPCGASVLQAGYLGDGRVAWVRVLGRRASFAYTGAATSVVDELGGTTVFHRSPDGLTEAVANPAGQFAQLAFDSAGRPVALARDGAETARMAYGPNGELASLHRDGGTTHFTHGPHGLVAAAGGSPAHYRYDGAGRVLDADDEAGPRAYGYDASGRLRSVFSDGTAAEIMTDATGALIEVRRDGQRAAAYGRDAAGRVLSLDYGNGLGATYQHDGRGFRTAAQYGDGVAARMRYDAAGNLVRHELAAPDGTEVAQDYEMGPHNELLRIRNHGQESPDLTFEYDALKRVRRARAGSRTADFDYDAVGRVTGVALDGEPLLDYAYGPAELDAAAARDRRTSRVPVPSSHSAAFGTPESVVHARPRPMDYGPVAYLPELGTFAVGAGHLAPDAVLRSALGRRMVPLSDPPDPSPFGHDKPSNSLFVPPEYFSVNCHVCNSSVWSFDVSVGDAEVGKAVEISIPVNGECSSGPPADGPTAGQPGGSNAPWYVEVDFGDGTKAETYKTSDPTLIVTHVYRAAGTYTVRATLYCGCDSLFQVASDSATVSVDEPCDPGPKPVYPDHPIPGVQTEHSVLDGSNWGNYFVAIRGFSGLRCVEVCPGSAKSVHRISGAITVSAYGLVTTKVAPPPPSKGKSCGVGDREDPNVTRTRAHEYHHLRRLIGVANDLQNVRRDHRTADSCKAQLKAIQSNFARRYKGENHSQECHTDRYFEKEQIYERHCPGDNLPATEVATGEYYPKCTGD